MVRSSRQLQRQRHLLKENSTLMMGIGTISQYPCQQKAVSSLMSSCMWMVRSSRQLQRQRLTFFFTTTGRLSIGGFGYSHISHEDIFPHLSPYVGKLDEFYMWGRAIEDNDIILAMEEMQ